MNAHERAIELGAARFDFALTAGELDVLDRHLATCPACRWDLDGMADDARRIESRPAARLSAASVERIRASVERPRRPISPAMVLVAAALLLLLAISAAVAGAAIVRRQDESQFAIEPLPSAMSSPGPTGVDPMPATWSLRPLGRTAGIPFQATAIARSELGWVAVGGMDCTQVAEIAWDCNARIARSRDGRTWETVAVPIATRYVPPSSGPEAGMDDVAAGPDGFVAVGFASAVGERAVRGTAWWSADGVAWETVRLGDGARPSTVFRAADRWLIGGVVYGNLAGTSLADADRPVGAIWTSSDGRTWTRLEDDEAFDVGGYVDTMEDPSSGGIRAFAWNGSTLVAAGDVCADSGLPCRAAAWTSSDRTAWERVGPLPRGDRLEDLVSTNGTFVAAARVCPTGADCATVLLRSDDGRAWQAVPGELAPFRAVSATGDTIVVVTGDDRALDVRASADGAVWSDLGPIAAPEPINLGAPQLVGRPDGGTDLLIRFDPVDAQGSEADSWTSLWEIVPAR